MKIAGLFAGIGGFEKGMALEGHDTELLCDVLPQSKAVLQSHFSNAEYLSDVCALHDLPENVELVTAGFPCQDLSQAGRTAGLKGVSALNRFPARPSRPAFAESRSRIPRPNQKSKATIRKCVHRSDRSAC